MSESKEVTHEYMTVNGRAARKTLKCRQPSCVVPEFRLI